MFQRRQNHIVSGLVENGEFTGRGLRVASVLLSMLFLVSSSATAQVRDGRHWPTDPAAHDRWGESLQLPPGWEDDPNVASLLSGDECAWTDEAFYLKGIDGYVYSSVVFNDGDGDALYVGGAFSIAGNVFANNIARWDGSSWSALGTGMSDGEVDILAVFDDGSGPALYAGGTFTTAGGVSANRIAKWDGSSWSALGMGMSDGVVGALTVFDDGGGPALYAGGSFTMAGGVSANRIAKWDGSIWSALDTGMSGTTFPGVLDLTVFDDGGGPALYAGGRFTTAGGVSANFIAKWDGSSWSALDTGMSGQVSALSVFDDGSGPALYAGGSFTTAGGVSVNRIAKWDGSSWSALGTEVFSSSQVYALTVFDNGGGSALYAGGYIPSVGGVDVNHIVKWNGSNWSALDTGVSRNFSYVFALTVFDDGGGNALYAGGWFYAAGGKPAHNIATWDGSSWSALGTEGVDSHVNALTVFDDGGGPALYAGGDFTTAGGVIANSIARWDGSTWSALGTGMDSNSTVYALTIFDDGSGPALYAGGDFTTAGGASANRIARWDGSTWSALGTGTGSTVYALTIFDDGGGPALYAGHSNGIAKWNGSTWSALGTGTSGAVRALTIFDDGNGSALYAGGDLTIAGGVSVNRIAKWDGSSWSALGTGMNNTVNALTIYDDGGGVALYAGGTFTVAGGVSASRIARWDGSSWSTLGAGTSNTVNALTVFDDGSGPALYAGGRFTMAGGVSANRIAKWDGSSWSALGTGMDSTVYAFTIFDDGSGPALYVGGNFITAGDVVSAYMAKWSCPSPMPPGPGDFNGDGVVDLLDYMTLSEVMNGPFTCLTESSRQLCDLDFDCDVDLHDFAAFLDAFGNE